jgi:hypothetical protein
MGCTKPVRSSINLLSQLAETVRRIARKRRLSDNRVLVDLVEQGLEAQKEKERRSFALAERDRAASDPNEIKKSGDVVSGSKPGQKFLRVLGTRISGPLSCAAKLSFRRPFF